MNSPNPDRRRPRLPPRPELVWREGAPVSCAYDDIYYARTGGFAESEAVFLSGCGLPAAWADARRFTILELGFGAGLNALAVWRAWAATRPAGALLQFVSIEAALMDAGQAARAHDAFPELNAWSRRLLARWPVRARGAQRLWFADDGFALTLVQNDVSAALADLRLRADAIFLDGFAPARNPAMWSADVMAMLAARAAPGARLATYSVAGAVRRNLEAAGFDVARKPGHGEKRERLEARLARAPGASRDLFPYGAAPGRIAIIGAGVAGACLAHALARRGRPCTILEADKPGAGASGNPAALVMPRLDRGTNAPAAFHIAAFIAAVRLYEELDAFTARGVEEGARGAEALADVIADPPLPSDWLTPHPRGLWHARGGVVRPEALLKLLLGDVAVIAGAPVARIEAREGGAHILIGHDGRALCEAEAVVIAAGAHARAFDDMIWLPMRLTRGQVEWARGVEGGAARAARSYAAPLDDGIVFGATFDPADGPPISKEDARRRNIAALQCLAPELAAHIHGEQILSRVSVRATAPDFMPIMGLMPHADEWRAQNAALVHGRRGEARDAPALKGVYMFGALGARGFTTAPLLAECLASELCDEPFVMPRSVRDAIHPARFLLRALKRREGISS